MANAPAVKNVAYEIGCALEDYGNPGNFKANPTLSTGDAKVDIDGAGFNNLGTLPSVSPAGSTNVKIVLAQSEMNGNRITVTLIDQTSPKEWADVSFVIITRAAAPVTVADILAQVLAGLNTAIPGSPTADSINERIKTLDDAYTATRAALLDNLDAAVSTRLPTSSYSAAPSAASIRAEIDSNSTKLDVTVGSRLATAGYTAPPSAASIRAEIDSNSSKLDVTVGSRLASASYTAPPSTAAIVAAIDASSVDLDAALAALATILSELGDIETAADAAAASAAAAETAADAAASAAGTAATAAGSADTRAANIQTRVPDALEGGFIKAQIKGVDDGLFTAAKFGADMNTYQAKVSLVDDDAGAEDKYKVVFLKNGQTLTAGVTVPKIKITKEDGTDLVAEVALPQIGASHVFLYTEPTNRITSGDAYDVTVTFTVDGSPRTWKQPIGRDSTA